MPSPLTRRFIDALRELERTADVEAIARVFSDDAKLSNSAAERDFEGRDGARAFWSMYRDTFGEVESEFVSVIEEGDRAALEWVSHGKTPEGRPFTYEGVTVLRFNGDRIGRLHAYFNPMHLRLRASLEELPAREGEGRMSAGEAAQVTDTSYARPGSTVQ